MAQAQRQPPATQKKRNSCQLLIRCYVTRAHECLPYTLQEGSFSPSLRRKKSKWDVLVNRRLLSRVSMLVSPAAEDIKRLCHSLKATLPYRICCWLGGYSSHHPSIVFRVSRMCCTSGDTVHSSESLAPRVAMLSACMNSTRLLHALEARNFGMSFTVLNNRSGTTKPVSCRRATIVSRESSAGSEL